MTHKEGENGEATEAREGNLCEQELLSLRGVFDACDENRDGFLTVDELCGWMKRLDLHLTREGLQEIVRCCDNNLDGRLNFDEFVVLSASLDNPSSKDEDGVIANESSEDHTEALDQLDPAAAELKEAFHVFDKDGNGLISPTELKATLSQLGLLAASTPFSRIQSMIRKVDTDGDGEVNFSEFQTMMKGQGNN